MSTAPIVLVASDDSRALAFVGGVAVSTFPVVLFASDEPRLADGRWRSKNLPVDVLVPQAPGGGWVEIPPSPLAHLMFHEASQAN